MSGTYLIGISETIQDHPISLVKYFDSEIAGLSENVVRLAAMIHTWDEVNCLPTHSNQNGLTPTENYQCFAKAFKANGFMTVSESGEFVANFDQFLEFKGENANKLKAFWAGIDQIGGKATEFISVEQCFERAYNFYQANSVNQKMVYAVEVGDEYFAALESFFLEKLEKHENFKAEWVSELNEVLS